jgi:hypothetical protein
MSEIINLNKQRKARDRAAEKAQADINAVKHGRTKAERLADTTRIEITRARLDQLKFEDE